MGRQRGQTSVDIRELIISHHKSGKTIREIGKLVNRSHSTVHNIVKRYQQFQNVENRPKKATNKIFSESDERFLVRKIKINPFLSAPKLAEIAEVDLGKRACASTIRNMLRKENLGGRRCRKKPFISDVNKKKRLQFAKDHRFHEFSFWEKVLFTDESKFNLFGSDGRPYVWRKPNEELLPKNLKPTIKHGGGSVMVWGSFSAAGPGILHFIDEIMDQKVYLNILKENLSESVEKLSLGDDWYFYQDNDPKHKAYNVRSWLLYNCPHVMETPPQSPDINPIENLWDYLGQRLKNHTISKKADLKKALIEEWQNISPEYCKKLVQSMQTRLKMVILNKGMHTKY